MSVLRFLIFIGLACVVSTSAETILFTNSPSHLVGSKNVTTYKLHVKNSDPITIIEANRDVPVSSAELFLNENDRIDVGSGGDDHKDIVSRMEASQQVEKTKTRDLRGAVSLTINSEPHDTSTSRNEYKVNGAATVSGAGIKKLVYSPILLKKFVKEYTDKLKNADPKTKNAIQEIHEQINGNKETERAGEEAKNDEPEQKYYSYSDHEKRRPSSHSTKDYATKDQSGWVTLEAVPWSSSSVSKWHPHDTKKFDDHRRPPSTHFERPYSSSGSRPSSHYPYEEDNVDEDYFNRRKPANIDRDSRPNVFSTWTKPQSIGRPQRPQYDFGSSDSFRDRFYDKPLSNRRPGGGMDDIVTDNRPSDFPDADAHESSAHYNRHQFSHHQNKYRPEDDIDRFHSGSASFHSSQHAARPEEGNGEWVLLSTTKGYQIPGGHRQHGKRSMSMSQGSVTENTPQFVAHKTVKLTVLPAENKRKSKNSAFSTDEKSDEPAMVTSHGGLIEVEATGQTVEEHVKETLQSQNANKTNKNDAKRRKVIKGNR